MIAVTDLIHISDIISTGGDGRYDMENYVLNAIKMGSVTKKDIQALLPISDNAWKYVTGNLKEQKRIASKNREWSIVQ